MIRKYIQMLISCVNITNISLNTRKQSLRETLELPGPENLITRLKIFLLEKPCVAKDISSIWINTMFMLSKSSSNLFPRVSL